MFKYQNNHAGKFVDAQGNSTLLPSTLIIAMQLGSSIATEIINLYLILDATNEKDCILNFIALGVISQIDDIYFQALAKEPLKEAVGENSPEIFETTKSLRRSGRDRKQYLVRKLYKLKKFAHAAYFYFLPMVVPIVAYMSPELRYIEDLAKKFQEGNLTF
jgi:hypothetical protein